MRAVDSCYPFKSLDCYAKILVNLDSAIPEAQNATPLKNRGELAQWIEQRNHNPLVPSSNLGFATRFSCRSARSSRP